MMIKQNREKYAMHGIMRVTKLRSVTRRYCRLPLRRRSFPVSRGVSSNVLLEGKKSAIQSRDSRARRMTILHDDDVG